MATAAPQEAGVGGRKWSYLGGAVALAAAIVAQLVGKLAEGAGRPPETDAEAAALVSRVVGIGAAADLATLVFGLLGVVLLVRAGRRPPDSTRP